jgi:hypothetical protein
MRSPFDPHQNRSDVQWTVLTVLAALLVLLVVVAEAHSRGVLQQGRTLLRLPE